jgi:hypothetical protein
MTIGGIAMKRGDGSPAVEMVTTSFRLPAPVLRLVRHFAVELGVDVQDVIIDALYYRLSDTPVLVPGWPDLQSNPAVFEVVERIHLAEKRAERNQAVSEKLQHVERKIGRVKK